ncbi:sialate O-acetylesterase [Pediococcus acidilactici]|uniref:sialate O-acetylesterase n=1 Tax=Pediococcus acidilactici TaxID=1254 RepID=UPI0007B69A91|nr:sialate O-acetylesterase [Pediococcus acidilactici]KZX39264.1 sialate O-acetylesterase [Pediococcus acidilactici]KZX40272.1 sialate O-acetylesterase [Pediococcus acidilactici]OAC46093.1 sialate O-acetylesterase [Pediococcus acidilactici]QHS02946.1 sialate O-acetylesterase [Pediococcus acidilactici]
MQDYQLQVDQIFSDNMILPFGKPFQISGLATAGATVKTTIGTQVARAIVRKDGTWDCQFRPFNDYRTSFEVKIEVQNHQLKLENVRFGQVLLIAGQSNVGFRMSQDQNFTEAQTSIPATPTTYYNVPQPAFVYEDGEVKEYQSRATHWHQVKKSNLGHVSAVGYYAAQEMARQDPKMPVGIVCCTRDGASAGTWVSETSLRKDKLLAKRVVEPFLSHIEKITDADFKADIERYHQTVKRHNRLMYNFMKSNPEVPIGEALNIVGQTPWPPPKTPDSYLRPGALFNAMVRKIRHFRFSQLVWYQGETDADQPEIYDRLLQTLINDWRATLADVSLPVYVVQLPKYADVKRHTWAKIRQQQLKVAQRLADTYLISIADTGEYYNPHPTAKMAAGQRIGRILAGKDYQATPQLGWLSLEAEQTCFHFWYVKELHATQPPLIEGYVQQKWQAVPAEIKGTDLRVHFPLGTTQARYGYSNAPTLTLFNEIGDPVSPFVVDLTTQELI